MQTNPDTPGVEKVCCTSVIPDWLTGKKTTFTIEDLGLEGLLPPQKVFMVKGWNRSVCMLGVLLAAFETPAILEVGQPYYYLDIRWYKIFWIWMQALSNWNYNAYLLNLSWEAIGRQCLPKSEGGLASICFFGWLMQWQSGLIHLGFLFLDLLKQPLA